MTKDELNDLLWMGRKLVSGLIGPDMWKYLTHKDETDSDMYIYDHGAHIDN